jgi:hypothetical protein
VPSKTDIHGIVGYVKVEVLGDFCDFDCLRHHAYHKAAQKDSRVSKVIRTIFFRGELGEERETKEVFVGG